MQKDLETVLLKLKENGLEEVQEYFDMDKFMDIRCACDYKPDKCLECRQDKARERHLICPFKERKRQNIRNGCIRLYELCDDLGLRYIRKTWDMNEKGIWNGNHKGIDDFWNHQLKKRKVMESELDTEAYDRSRLSGCKESSGRRPG